MTTFFNNLPVLNTERLILRPVQADDIQDIYAYAKDPEVSFFVPWEVHNSIEDTRQFVNFVLADYAAGRVNCWALVLKEIGKVVGTAGFNKWSPGDRRAEVGYTLARELWGQGLTSEAMGAIICFGFEELNLLRIDALCQVDNIASARVMEKSGLKFEGVLRQYYFIKGAQRDMKIYSIIRSEWEAGR